MSDINDAILEDIKDLGRALRDHIPTIVGVVVLVLAAAFFLLVTTPDKYRAVSLLMLDSRPSQSQAVPLPEMSMTDEEKVLLTEIEILRSREIADPVIARFSLDKRAEFNPDIPSPSRLERFGQWAQNAIGVDPLVAIGMQVPPAEFGDNAAGVSDHLVPVARFGETEIAAGEEKPGLFPAEVYRKFYAALDTHIRGGSRIVEVAFTSSNAELAQDVANAVSQAYLSMRKQSTIADADATTEWLGDRIKELEGQVQTLEANYANKQEKSGILVDGQAPILTQQIEQLNEHLTELRSDEAQLNARYQRIKSSLAGEQYGSLVQLVDTPQMGALKAELAGKLAELNSLKSSLGERHPRLIASEAEVETIEGRVRMEAEAFVSQLNEQVRAKEDEATSVSARIDSLRGELGGMGQQRADLSGLDRQIAAKRDLLNNFLERRAQLGQAQDQRIVRSPLALVSQASLPQLPASPNRPLLMVVAAVFGLIFGMVLALMIDMMSRRLRRRGQLKRIAGTVRILGYLPPLKSGLLSRSRKATAIYDEAARRLQSSLSLALKTNTGGPGKVVMLTSSQPAEGKTTTSQALAEKAARGGLEVLLVNCDPKKPKGRYEPTLGGQNGVIEVLKGTCPVDLAVTAAIGTEGLHLLPSGDLTEANQDLLGGPAMEALLVELRNSYDLVILDAPPLMSLSYVLSLGAKTDFVAYVARWRRAGVREVIEGVRQFRDHDVTVGLIMTNMHRGAALKFGLRPIQSYYQAYIRTEAEI